MQRLSVLGGAPFIACWLLAPHSIEAAGITGRVVDRLGRGVVGAMVFHSGDAPQRVETTTDADGRFSLEGVPEGELPIFAEKAGYRFTGSFCEGEANLTLIKEDETPAPLVQKLQQTSHAERLALAHRLLDSYLAAVVDRGRDRDKYSALAALGGVDPVDALDRCNHCTFSDKTWQATSRGDIVTAWIETKPSDDWDEIRGLIEANEDPMWVSMCYLRAAHAMSADESAARLEWVHQAALHARQIKEPAIREVALAQAALALQREQQPEQAAKLVAETRGAVEPLVEDVFSAAALSFLAEAVAPTDLQAAHDYVGKIQSDQYFARACTRVALRLAVDQPAEAEKFWRRAIERKNNDRAFLDWRDRGLPLLCFRLAGADQAIAERVAASVDDAAGRVRARGAIALALAGVDAPAAGRFLHEAIHDEAFSKGTFGESVFGRDAAASVMAWLLPIVERVDPSMGGEVFWRAVALRPPAHGKQEAQALASQITLAQMLARYDVSVARRLLAPVATCLGEWSRSTLESQQKAMLLVGAAAVIDTRWAAELLEEIPKPPDLAFQHIRHQARFMLVRELGHDDATRWKRVGYFDPQDEDLP